MFFPSELWGSMGKRLVSRMPGRKDLLTQVRFFLGIWGHFQVSVELPPSIQMGPGVRPTCCTNVETEAQTWPVLLQISGYDSFFAHIGLFKLEVEKLFAGRTVYRKSTL